MIMFCVIWLMYSFELAHLWPVFVVGLWWLVCLDFWDPTVVIWFVNFRLANGMWCSLSSYLGAISTNRFLCSCWLRKDLWVLGNCHVGRSLCHVESLLSNQCMTNGWLRQKLNTTYLYSSCQFFMKSDKLCGPCVSAIIGLDCLLLCVISTV